MRVPQKAFFIVSIFLVIFLSFSWSNSSYSGGDDQPDFPNIYIDEGCSGTKVGSEANPYDDLSDINWTAGGDNSVADAVTANEDVAISLNKGDEWREQMTIGASGSAAHPITITSYGSGDDPIINGADLVETWIEDTTTVTPSVTANDDDVFVRPSISHWNSGTLPWWGHAANNIDWNAALRFQLNVPKDATITAATITIKNETADADTVRAKIYAHDVDDSDQITTYAEWNTDHGTLTIANADWDESNILANTEYISPSLVSIVQEIINRAGWVANQYIQFFIDDDNSDAAITMTLYTFEDESDYPSLSVTYNTPNVWKATVTTQPYLIWLDGTIGDKKASKGALVDEYDWYWASNVLYVYSTTDPDTAYASPGIEAATRNYCINGTTKQYITIQNIKCQYSNAYGIRFHEAQANGYCIIDSCTIYYCRITGIQFYNGHENNTAQNCTISYCGNGAYANTADNNTFSDNTISNCINYSAPAATDGHGMGVYDCTGTIIDGGTFSGNYTNIQFSANSGAHTCLIQNIASTAPQSGSSGISFADIASGGWVKVYYNLVYSGVGADISGGTVNGNAYIYNNSVYSEQNGVYTIRIAADASNYVFKNNIVYNNQATGNLMRIDSGTITSDYNCWYGPNMTNILHTGGTDYTSVANWNIGTSQDANSLEQDPLMTDPTNDDFRLLMASPCIDAGTDVSLVTDYDGIQIRHTPDIGAYENQTNAIFRPELLLPVLMLAFFYIANRKARKA